MLVRREASASASRRDKCEIELCDRNAIPKCDRGTWEVVRKRGRRGGRRRGRRSVLEEQITIQLVVLWHLAN